MVSGGKVAHPYLGTFEEAVDFVGHDSVNPGIGRGSPEQVKYLELAHAPGGKATSHGGRQAGEDAEKSVDQVGEAQKEEELVEWVLAHLAVGDDPQKDNNNPQTEDG